MAKARRKDAICRGFPPIAAADARVLVLGSMPSVASLAKRQYYGHPQNAFWRIMGRLFGAGLVVPYERRAEILREAGVAVWDSLQSCERPGSLDSSIRRESEQPNDFIAFFRGHPQIRSVFFNGQMSENAYRRHVLESVSTLDRKFRYVRLPSTSPAHAGRSFDEKLLAWRAVKRAARQSSRSAAL